MAALIWAGVLSVQLRTGLLSASSSLASFFNSRRTANGAGALASGRNPTALLLILVTEGSKLAVLLWAIVAALKRRKRQGISIARDSANVSGDDKAGVCAKSEEQVAEVEADAMHKGTEV